MEPAHFLRRSKAAGAPPRRADDPVECRLGLGHAGQFVGCAGGSRPAESRPTLATSFAQRADCRIAYLCDADSGLVGAGR